MLSRVLCAALILWPIASQAQSILNAGGGSSGGSGCTVTGGANNEPLLNNGSSGCKSYASALFTSTNSEFSATTGPGIGGIVTVMAPDAELSSGDGVASILLSGNNTSGSLIGFGDITALAVVATAGSETGSVTIAGYTGGTISDFLTLSGTEAIFGDTDAAKGEYLLLYGATSGTIKVKPNATSGTTTFVLPSGNGTSGYFLETDGSGNTSWAAASAASITVGTTTVSGGTTAYLLYNNGGTLGNESLTTLMASPPAIGGTSAAAGTFTTLSFNAIETGSSTSTACTLTSSGNAGCSGVTDGNGDCGSFIKHTANTQMVVTIPNSMPVGCQVAFEDAGTYGARGVILNGSAVTAATLHSAHSYLGTDAQYSVVGITIDANSGGSSAIAVLTGDGD